jgi:uncharacterized protein YerC
LDGENSDPEKKESAAAETPAKRGRAAFVPTGEQRLAVRKMAGAGNSHANIASAVGISVPTLRKAFDIELKDRLGDENLFTAVGDAPPAEVIRQRVTKRRGAGGRKKYKPTQADREQVALLVATGMAVGNIAQVIGISEPTLNKNFADELNFGAVRKRAKWLQYLEAAAEKGNVAASKELISISDRAALGALEDEFRGKAAPRADDEDAARGKDALGKKEIADVEAREAQQEGGWGSLLVRH